MAITIPILTDFKGEGIDRGIAQFNKLEGAGAKAGFLIRKAALPAAAAIGALGAGAVVAAKAAAEDAAAQDKLAGTLRRVTGASDAAVASTEGYISSLSQTVGVADDELRPALGKLATATGDITKAQQLLSTALDVSAQTGKPLDTVVTGLSKAYGGNLGALNKLLPGFNQGIIKSKDFTKAQEELSRLTGGAAADNANTAAGKFRKFQITLDETKESIGAALLPVFERMLPILQRVAQWVQENTGLVTGFAAAIGVLAAGVLAANAVMRVYTAVANIMKVAQIALNLALTMNPIGIVVVAIGALIGALALVYAKSEGFRNAVDALWGVVKTVFGWIGNIAETYFNGVKLAFGVIKTAVEAAGDAVGTAYNAIKTAFDWIKNNIIGGVFDVAAKVWEVLSKPVGVVGQAFKTVYDAGATVINFLKGLGRGVFAGIAAAFRVLSAPIEVVANAMQRVKDLWEWAKKNIQGVGGNPFAGGAGGNMGGTGGTVITGPQRINAVPSRLGSMGTAPASINVQVSAGLVSSPDQVGQQIIQAIQRAQRRSGPAFAAA